MTSVDPYGMYPGSWREPNPEYPGEKSSLIEDEQESKTCTIVSPLDCHDPGAVMTGPTALIHLGHPSINQSHLGAQVAYCGSRSTVTVSSTHDVTCEACLALVRPL